MVKYTVITALKHSTIGATDSYDKYNNNIIII